MGLVLAGADPTYNNWTDASIVDSGFNQEEYEAGQPNPFSQRVQLVQNSWGMVNYDALNGSLTNNYTSANFRADIESTRIVVIGTSTHYYVVYGYDDSSSSEFTLIVRDPWPAAVGGQRDKIPYSVFSQWNNKVVIHFR